MYKWSSSPSRIQFLSCHQIYCNNIWSNFQRQLILIKNSNSNLRTNLLKGTISCKAFFFWTFLKYSFIYIFIILFWMNSLFWKFRIHFTNKDSVSSIQFQRIQQKISILSWVSKFAVLKWSFTKILVRTFHIYLLGSIFWNSHLSHSLSTYTLSHTKKLMSKDEVFNPCKTGRVCSNKTPELYILVDFRNIYI